MEKEERLAQIEEQMFQLDMVDIWNDEERRRYKELAKEREEILYGKKEVGSPSFVVVKAINGVERWRSDKAHDNKRDAYDEAYELAEVEPMPKSGTVVEIGVFDNNTGEFELISMKRAR